MVPVPGLGSGVRSEAGREISGGHHRGATEAIVVSKSMDNPKRIETRVGVQQPA